jgi:hypothetical protein
MLPNVGLSDRWKNANRLAYLSTFERRPNRSLWVLAVAGVAYAVLEHVFLAEIPEVFEVAHDGAT